jgi:hypothetical protein
MRTYAPKTCRVCALTFQPTGPKQWRCAECAATDAHPGPVPLCECGCGKPVTWSRKRGGWNQFVHGHAVRVVETPPATGHTPWNKGRQTRYEHTCGQCHRKFENSFVEASFCSQACRGQYYSGKRNPQWEGGFRTRYLFDAHNRRVHRVVMAGLLGRKLKKSEVVHHIDKDGTNNEPSNLHLFHCAACHSHFHKSGDDLKYFYSEVHC